ncbi:MAG: type I methionyl aminopeptidase [Fibrobacteres bacterium]|nr:type I methionyl aminopeptidase [Fibrobacterota bacterium]
MINLYSHSEIERIRASCSIVHDVLDMIGAEIRPGVTTGDLDKKIHQFIRTRGAQPAFLGYRGFPASACVSINEQVVHGIPGKRKIKSGDLVSIDVGVVLDGFFGDGARTYSVGGMNNDQKRLVNATECALQKAIDIAVVGNRISDLSAIIEDTVNEAGCQAVRDLVGHGIGRQLHEDPQVPNYRSNERDSIIRNGMVFAIEPMINLGTWEVETLGDGWTVVTADGRQSAHFEHTVAIVNGSAVILTAGK